MQESFSAPPHVLFLYVTTCELDERKIPAALEASGDEAREVKNYQEAINRRLRGQYEQLRMRFAQLKMADSGELVRWFDQLWSCIVVPTHPAGPGQTEVQDDCSILVPDRLVFHIPDLLVKVSKRG